MRTNSKTRMVIGMSKRAPLTFNVDKVVPVAVAVKQTDLPAKEKTRKRAKPETTPGREGRQFIAAHVPPDAAKQFKLLAVQHDKTTQEMLIEAINDFFAKHGLSRIA
jgi:hypothetical protein